MATIYLEAQLNLEPDALWRKIADLGGISELLDVVTHSTHEAGQRTCLLANGAKLTERITGVDVEHRRVAYSITEGPFLMSFHAASMQVSEAQPGASLLTWICDVSPDEVAPALGEIMEAEMRQLERRFP